MNNLSTYISAIDTPLENLKVIDKVDTQNTVEEEDLCTERSELVVTFNNGVVLKRVIEQDHYGTPLEDVCPDCWIAYEVIQQPENVDIRPQQKYFTNACQASFWLKINRMQSVE